MSPSISTLRDLDAAALQRYVVTSAGDTYNAEAVEKSLVNLTTEVSRRGYAFAQVRPRGDRDSAGRLIGITYVVDEGPRVYVERINVRGNTRTRDYVVRRELDLGEGDAYNKVMVDRAERRLNNLGFFNKVRITNEPGSAPDRVVVNIDVEDKATGSFSIAGGYSTSDGVIGEVSLSESNFLGRGQFVRIAGHARPAHPGRRLLLHRALFPRPPHRGRLRPVLEVQRQLQHRPLREPRDGRHGPLDLPDHGRVLDHAALLDLHDRDRDSEHDLDRPYNDCTVPIDGHHAGTGGAQRPTYQLLDQWRSVDRGQGSRRARR